MTGRWTQQILLTVLCGIAVTAAVAGGDERVEAKPYYSEIAQQFARRFPYQHLRQVPLDDRVSAQAWTNYLAALDYEHVYFLASDIEKLAGSELTLDDQLRAGQLNMAFNAFNTYRERVEERLGFVTNQLARGFDFDREEEYQWKRKKAPWPADRAAQDELWRQRLKHEMLRLTVASIVATNSVSSNQLAAATNVTLSVTNAIPVAAVSTA